MKIDFKTRYGMIKTYDPNAASTPVLTKYKAKDNTVVDAAMFYAPYIPLQMISTGMPTNRIDYMGEVWGWTTFIVDTTSTELTDWCKENFGRQHRGIYLSGLKLWLSNGGRWRQDGRGQEEIGFRYAYTRIWLKREADITLFKMRWA
jgi:hypothetical protein